MQKARLKKGDHIPFTQISNAVLYSPNLSFKAKGLYAYMLAKPDGWNFSARRIAEETKEAEKSIRGSIKELIDIGLIKYNKLPTGRVEYTIFTNIAEPNGQKGDKAMEPNGQKGKQPKRQTAERATIRNKETYKQRVLKNRSKKSSIKSDECINSHETNKSGIDQILRNLTKRVTRC